MNHNQAMFLKLLVTADSPSLSGENNPMLVNAVNNSDVQQSYIGIAKNTGKDGEDNGLVYVEMSPTE